MATRTRDSLGHLGAARRSLGLGAALLASAALMSIALESGEGHWLGWFTLIPLFLSIRVLTPLPAFLAGAFWGVGLFLFLMASGRPPFAPSVWPVVLLGAVPGAYAWLGAQLTRRIGFSPLLLALGWIAAELALRPLGLHNGLLAGTQGHGLVVKTLGYLAGYVVVAFIIAYVNASLLAILRDVCVPVGGSRSRPEPASSAKRLFPIVLPARLSRLFRPSQARAPPLGFHRLW